MIDVTIGGDGGRVVKGAPIQRKDVNPPAVAKGPRDRIPGAENVSKKCVQLPIPM